jgi:hypothetical protein
MTAPNSIIVYHSRTAEAFDNAMWDGTLFPIFASLLAFLCVVYVLGTMCSGMMRRSWVDKIPKRLHPAYFFVYRHSTLILLIVAGLVSWLVFTITFSYVI